MSEICTPIGCPEVVRLTEQDPCTGRPRTGPGKGFGMRCSRNVEITADVREGDTSEFVSDCGIPLRFQQDSITQGYNFQLEVARLSSELHAKLLGYDLLADGGGNNVGFLEGAVAGCAVQAERPTWIWESFHRVLACDAGGGTVVRYRRRVIQGLKFQPVEEDKEGEIAVERFTAVSSPMATAGLIPATVALAAGPYHDFPATIKTQLNTTLLADPGHLNVGMRFLDPIVDPLAGAGVVAVPGTCYSLDVPADA